MKIDLSLQDKLYKLFSSQKLGVLATQDKKNPYTSLVAFACSDNLREIVFATPKATRKFANINSNPNVSFFIDNRTNKSTDFRKGIGVTVLGCVRNIHKNNKLPKLYLTKHPQLDSFLASKSCVLLCIDVSSYYIVERFQSVTEVNLD